VIAAIPTTYGGTQFRSRLEARWAAFFDLLRFPWKYEPFDCDGYIPDFLLFDRLLIEVKPIVWGQPRHGDEPGREEAKRKLLDAMPGRVEYVALVGVGIHEFTPGHAIAGTAHHAPNASDPQPWNDLYLDWWPSCAEISFEGQPTLGAKTNRASVGFEAIWREAGNRVQWRSPR
jgi:hypothetical protein